MVDFVWILLWLPKNFCSMLLAFVHVKARNMILYGLHLKFTRVRNSANPCVRDMSKYLRTCQMSVHGYPADMSIFCNLQLGLLKLQEDTPQADIDQDNVSLAGVLQGAVGSAV